MFNDKEQTKDKYKIKKKKLILHYAVIGGEIPSNLIKEIVSYGTWKRAINTGSYKGLLIYKRGEKHQGFQLSSKASDEIKKLPYDYTPYLLKGEIPVKLTNNRYQRIRNQMRTRFFVFLDALGIEYMRERIKDSESTFFYDARLIKKRFEIQSRDFAREQDREFQILGSRALGVLKTNDAVFLTYAFEKRLIRLQKSIESRITIYAQNLFGNYNYGQLIYCLTTEYATLIAIEIIESIVFPQSKNENNYKTQLLSYFRSTKKNAFLDSAYRGLHVAGLDNTGIIQTAFFLNQNKVNEFLRTKLKKEDTAYSREKEQEYIYSIEADGILHGNPCYFLFTLEIKKITRLIYYAANNPNIVFNIILSREYIENGFKRITDIVNRLAYEQLNNIRYISIEQFNLLDSF